MNMEFNPKKVVLGVLLLTAVEQGLKLLINAFYLTRVVPIWEPYLYFKPMFNRDYSWFNSMFQLGIGKWVHIVFVMLLLAALYLFYKYVTLRFGTSRSVDALALFIFSGAVCSLIDKVFWGGSLDYILVEPLFTFDLKDVYINVFIGLLILLMLMKDKALKRMDEERLFKGFFAFVFHKT